MENTKPEIKNPEPKEKKTYKDTDKDIETFIKLLSNQQEIAAEFKECYNYYAYGTLGGEKGNLYKFSEKDKLWMMSSESEYINDYNKWLMQIQTAFISSNQLPQKHKQELVNTITKKLDYNFGSKVYKYAKNIIFEKDLIDNFDKKYPYLIPTKDGKCYDLKTSTLIERTREHYMTYCYNANYTANESKEVKEMLNQICCKDEKVMIHLQKILGYCMSGENGGQVFFVFNGKGSNGKSLLLNLVKACMNKAYGAVDKAVMIKEKSSNIANAFYALSKRRLGVFNETNEGEKLNEENLKKISGNDMISCKKLYSDLGDNDITLKCKLILCTNKLPHFDSTQESLTRRLRLVKFNASFVDTPTGKTHEYLKDLRLEDTIVEKHLDEFFSWCIKGYALAAEDLSFNKNVPDTIKASQNEYFKNQNSFKCFYDDQIEITKEREDTIERSKLYTKYVDFCTEYDISIVLKKKEIFDMADNEFGKAIKYKGIFIYRYCKINPKKGEKVEVTTETAAAGHELEQKTD
jgi:putative DNA primase/helicase